jgi:hypothetical protein
MPAAARRLASRFLTRLVTCFATHDGIPHGRARRVAPVGAGRAGTRGEGARPMAPGARRGRCCAGTVRCGTKVVGGTVRADLPSLRLDDVPVVALTTSAINQPDGRATAMIKVCRLDREPEARDASDRRWLYRRRRGCGP